MSRYTSAVKIDIGRWLANGWIDQALAARLAQDVDAHDRRGFSFGGVLAILAALMIGAAVLLFVAANWNEIPRLVRVGAIFALLIASYIGGAAAKTRGHPAYGEGLYLLGAMTFGAGIALIGQMYHLSGDEAAAVLVWCLGVASAAALLRSPILTIAAVVLAGAWFLIGIGDYRADLNWWYPALLALLWLASYWSGNSIARHLILLSLLMFGVVASYHAVERGYCTIEQAGGVFAGVSALVFLIAYLAPRKVEEFARLGGPYPAHPLVGFLIGMGMIQVSVARDLSSMLIASVIALAGIIAALLMRGRESRLMRWIAYLAFTGELIFIYVTMVGSMMNTSMLFLAFGLGLAVMAWIFSRIEKSMLAAAGAQ